MLTKIDSPMETELKSELWHRGDIDYMLRRHGQTWCYRHFKRHLNTSQEKGELLEVGWNCHRRMGKTFLLLILCFMWCLKRPRQQVKFFAPTKLMAKDIVEPVLNFILEGCPHSLHPVRRGGRREWVFHNPYWDEADGVTSNFKLYAVNKGQADTSRGTACDFAALDECGLYENMSYLINDVLLPQFVGRPGPAMVMATSAPRSPAHEFFEVFEPKLQALKRFMTVTGQKNPDFTEADKRNILQSCPGGEDSVSWRREFGCEKIADASSMILPEFADLEDKIVVSKYKRPKYFQPVQCLDTGWVDFTAIVYGYVDFHEAKLIIEHVIWSHYTSTGQLAEQMKIAEEELYPEKLLKKMGKKRIKRYGDMTPQQMDDFRKDHKIFIRPVEKYDRDGAIARLRHGLQTLKIKIVRNPSTEPLIYQARHGIWNENRTDFARLVVGSRAEHSMMGHMDCVAALTYLYRMINFNSNPYPTPKGLGGSNVFNPDFEGQRDRSNISKAFGGA